MKKVLMIMAIMLTVITIGREDSYAVENTEKLETEVVYDMTKGGVQTFETINEFGEEVTLTVEKEPSMLRAVGNGTYNITASTLQWKAGYKISVTSDRISSAYGGYHSSSIGSFTSARLVVDSSKQATYYLNRRVGLIDYPINLRAKLLTNTISVSY